MIGNIRTFMVISTSAGWQTAGDVLQKPKDITSRLSEWSGYIGASFRDIVLDGSPTVISDVTVEQLTSTSVVITWKTNHQATSKVNYGTTLDFGKDKQTTKRSYNHRVEITGLDPNTTYYYEVMSQSRDYVYDAHHVFVTPDE